MKDLVSCLLIALSWAGPTASNALEVPKEETIQLVDVIAELTLPASQRFSAPNGANQESPASSDLEIRIAEHEGSLEFHVARLRSGQHLEIDLALQEQLSVLRVAVSPDEHSEALIHTEADCRALLSDSPEQATRCVAELAAIQADRASFIASHRAHYWLNTEANAGRVVVLPRDNYEPPLARIIGNQDGDPSAQELALRLQIPRRALPLTSQWQLSSYLVRLSLCRGDSPEAGNECVLILPSNANLGATLERSEVKPEAPFGYIRLRRLEVERFQLTNCDLDPAGNYFPLGSGSTYSFFPDTATIVRQVANSTPYQLLNLSTGSYWSVESPDQAELVDGIYLCEGNFAWPERSIIGSSEIWPFRIDEERSITDVPARRFDLDEKRTLLIWGPLTFKSDPEFNMSIYELCDCIVHFIYAAVIDEDAATMTEAFRLSRAVLDDRETIRVSLSEAGPSVQAESHLCKLDSRYYSDSFWMPDLPEHHVLPEPAPCLDIRERWCVHEGSSAFTLCDFDYAVSAGQSE